MNQMFYVFSKIYVFNNYRSRWSGTWTSATLSTPAVPTGRFRRRTTTTGSLSVVRRRTKLVLSRYQSTSTIRSVSIGQVIYTAMANSNKKRLKNVGPIRHCEPPHANSLGVATVARAHRCPRQRRQRQRVTERTATAIAP